MDASSVEQIATSTHVEHGPAPVELPQPQSTGSETTASITITLRTRVLQTLRGWRKKMRVNAKDVAPKVPPLKAVETFKQLANAGGETPSRQEPTVASVEEQTPAPSVGAIETDQIEPSRLQEWQNKIQAAYKKGDDLDLKQMVNSIAAELPGGGEHLSENIASAARRLAEILSPESQQAQRDLILPEVTGANIAAKLSRIAAEMQNGIIANPQRYSEVISGMGGGAINQVSLNKLEQTLQQLSKDGSKDPHLTARYASAVAAIDKIKGQLGYTNRQVIAKLFGKSKP